MIGTVEKMTQSSTILFFDQILKVLKTENCLKSVMIYWPISAPPLITSYITSFVFLSRFNPLSISLLFSPVSFNIKHSLLLTSNQWNKLHFSLCLSDSPQTSFLSVFQIHLIRCYPLRVIFYVWDLFLRLIYGLTTVALRLLCGLNLQVYR